MKGILKSLRTDETKQSNHTKSIRWNTSTVQENKIPYKDNSSLERAIQKGNLEKVKNILGRMDNDKIQELLMEKEGAWVWLLFTNTNDKSVLKSKYNGKAFKDIIDIFMKIDSDIVSKAYNGFMINLMFDNKEGDVQIIADYLEVANAFKASQNEETHESADLEKTSEEKLSDIDNGMDNSTFNENAEGDQRSSVEYTKDVVANGGLNNAEEKCKSMAIEEDEVPLSSIALKDLYAWLQDLPENLQKYFLSTAPIKTLIESAKLDSAVYKRKSMTEDFYDKVIYVGQDQSQGDIIENDLSEKAQVDDAASSAEMIDMTMILLGSAVSYLILPTIIESVPLSGKDSFFAGEAGLNLLNCIELF